MTDRGRSDRLLVCPECGTLIRNAGQGRAFCSGQQDTFWHKEREMEAFVREPVAEPEGEK